MRFVIATLPDVKFSLGRDVGLLKTCALYGDECVLFSPTYEGISPLLDFSKRPLLHQLIYLGILMRDPGFIVGEKLTKRERCARIQAAEERSRDLLSKASRVLALRSKAAKPKSIEKELDKILTEIRPLCDAVARTFPDDEDSVQRAKELAEAEKIGLVKLRNIHDVPSIYFSEETLKTDIRTELSRSDSYGALDERFLPECGDLTRGVSQKLGIARIATDIFSRLPGFSSATFREIHDIRKEFAPHLVRFRAAIVDISSKIQSAVWDEDFPHDVERELQLRLYPAVSEIEAQVKTNSYLREILYRAVTNPLVVPASSAFGLVLSSATKVPALLTQVASGLAGVGLLAFEAHKEWKAAQRKIEGNEFFFYYRAASLLGNKKHRK